MAFHQELCRDDLMHARPAFFTFSANSLGILLENNTDSVKNRPSTKAEIHSRLLCVLKDV